MSLTSFPDKSTQAHLQGPILVVLISNASEDAFLEFGHVVSRHAVNDGHAKVEERFGAHDERSRERGAAEARQSRLSVVQSSTYMSSQPL